MGGLARSGRVVVLGYAAGTETTMRVTDLVWKPAHVSRFSLFAASAEEQAAAYAAVLPLIASGEIVPAHDRLGPEARRADRGPAVRHGDPERGRIEQDLDRRSADPIVLRPAGGGSSGQPGRVPAGPGWPMKSSSAWLTSSAWVQMIACGPPAMTVERAFVSSAGSLLLVAS